MRSSNYIEETMIVGRTMWTQSKAFLVSNNNHYVNYGCEFNQRVVYCLREQVLTDCGRPIRTLRKCVSEHAH